MSVLKTKKLIVKTGWSWTESFADYKASDGYTLKIHFYKDSTNKLSLTGVADGDDYDFTADSTTTNKSHGLYSYQIVATLSSIDYLVERGQITLLPNLAETTDARGDWTIIYESLLAAYKEMATRNMVSVNINGVSVTYEDRTKLLRDLQNAKVQMEIETGKRTGQNKRYLSRFSE